ncbi:hypothetical protein [Acidithiobacillus concretivorus]|uniref:Uncharacterized protein n=1 Tax=Acidithiobacillus concretivorus TaxID=3063952 RepID=A0ABS5ZSY3_9PROT|nr:hypothetical protein [Acidithiobacillus concretivorus]MBU2739792.1 hypothetical protein [Acidithiobacillus concretivorus]
MNISTRHRGKEVFKGLDGAVTLYAELRVTAAHNEAVGPVGAAVVVGPVESFYLTRRLVLAD